MTTIAYRDGKVAADSRSMRGGWIQPTKARKLRRLNDGTLAAITGDAAEFEAWLVRYLTRQDNPRPAPELKETTIIHFLPSGTIRVFECGGHEELDANVEFCAWGSGAALAIAAMEAGAAAGKAVAIASRGDPYTGGDIVLVPVVEVA